MDVTIRFTREEEARLRAAARTRGLKVEDLAHRLVSSQLSPPIASPRHRQPFTMLGRRA